MLQVSRISKKYRKTPVLSDVSFEADFGDCIGLIGPNGCGKSTLLRILAGILKADSGAFLFEGKDCFSSAQTLASVTGFLPQDNPLFDDASALDHLKLWYSGCGYDLSEDLKNGLPARLGVDAFLGRKVSELSGGMKKRLSLACVLCRRPPVILLDEPAAALDLPGKQEIRNFLKELKQEGRIILFSTHEEADFPLCTALLTFNGGCVEKQLPDSPETFFTKGRS